MGIWLPDVIFLDIASRLQEADVCGLGSSDRFWRGRCSYDSLWESFARKRWPSLSSCQGGPSPTDKGWRELYVKRHNDMKEAVLPLVHRVEESLLNSQSLEIGLYREVLGELKSLELSLLDVKMLMFKPKYSILLHLVALHYCCMFLQAPVKEMVRAVEDSQISEGQVWVQWSPISRLLVGFHLTEEPRSLLVSLREIASSCGHGILRVLNRRVVLLKVMPVQISLSNPAACHGRQISTGQNQDSNDCP
ncbi:hypothetical protein MLD38_010704 [Melastoma candidum]|uniref:Uncharacterized protein n=1 Tax=Melastoma candidum TaxID=119954 RepID=A0ACB9R0Q3_9MYRT|nr:hypothetical protein MLD38_010704 [Melastoma candidum]